MTARPPTIPPTIAPMLLGLEPAADVVVEDEADDWTSGSTFVPEALKAFKLLDDGFVEEEEDCDELEDD